MMIAEKLPPHNIAAEEAIIGSLLVDDTVMKRIGTLVQPQDFFRERNRWVYEAALRVIARNEPTDPISIVHELAQGSDLDELRHAAFISHCIATVPTSVHAEYYAKLVHELADRRREIQRGGIIAAKGFNGQGQQRKSYY